MKNVRGVRAVRGVRRRSAAVPLVAVLGVLLAGCGIRATEVPTDFGPAPSRVPCSLSEVSAPAAPDAAARTPAGVPVQVFLLCGSQLVTVDRSVRVPDGTAEARRRVLVAQGLLDELARTPTASESEAGYTTDVRGGMSVSGPGPKDPKDALRLSAQIAETQSLTARERLHLGDVLGIHRLRTTQPCFVRSAKAIRQLLIETG